jgi:hypothetical protein
MDDLTGCHHWEVSLWLGYQHFELPGVCKYEKTKFDLKRQISGTGE